MTAEGKIKRRNVRLETVVVFQWVTTRLRDVRYFPAMCAKARNRAFNPYNQLDDRMVQSAPYTLDCATFHPSTIR